MLVIDADRFPVNTAIQRLNLPQWIAVRFFIHQALVDSTEAQRFVTASDVVIVDVMGWELTKWLLDHLDINARPVYALRGSQDDDALRRRGIVFDPAIKSYFDHLSTANVRNLIRQSVFPYQRRMAPGPRGIAPAFAALGFTNPVMAVLIR